MVGQQGFYADNKIDGIPDEYLAKYFTKGRPIFVEGRLRLNEWQTPTGEKRSKLQVVMENFVFVGPNTNTQHTDDNNAAPFSYEKVEQKQDAESTFNAADEDVPF